MRQFTVGFLFLILQQIKKGAEHGRHEVDVGDFKGADCFQYFPGILMMVLRRYDKTGAAGNPAEYFGNGYIENIRGF